MFKLMIVEDDVAIAKAIKKHAQVWDIDTLIVENFRNVLEEFSQYQPHLVLLDISLPYFDGYYWCKAIREISNIPIIFISSASDNMNIIMAINMGGDDFIAKPFDLNVLMAKIQALLRRSYDYKERAPVLEHQGVFLNTADNSLIYKGKEIPLTKNEYKIMLCLMENKGKIVSREKLMERLWKTESFIDDNTLTVNVNRLRKKLKELGLNDFISTKVGSGYILK